MSVAVEHPGGGPAHDLFHGLRGDAFGDRQGGRRRVPARIRGEFPASRIGQGGIVIVVPVFFHALPDVAGGLGVVNQVLDERNDLIREDDIRAAAVEIAASAAAA